MKCIELNPAGSFDTWDPAKLEELKQKQIGEALGQNLLFENENIRVWKVVLFPGDRLPFRKINRNYSFVSMIEGLALTRCDNGKITMLRLKKGDTGFMPLEGTESIHDLENIGENILFLHAMEFKPLVEEANSHNITSSI